MPVHRLEDLVAYQFALEFKLEVYRIIDESAEMHHAYKYKEQLRDAASGIESCIAEGFARFVPGEFAQFLRYALGSLKEAETRLNDGVHRNYFALERCELAFTWARRCRAATAGLRASQEELAEKQRLAKTKRARGSGAPKSDGPPPRSGS